MIEVPLDGENSNDNDDASVSQSCRGRHNQYGLSPRQLRLLQAERRRRAAAAASSSSATAATDNSPKLDTSAECNNDDGVSLIPSPIATRYSTPPRETLSLPSSSSFCHGSSNKTQHKNFGFGSGSNSGASIAELTDATTTTSTTTLSTHVEDSIQRRKLQLKHISSSNTSTLATNHTVGNNDNEHTNNHDSVIPVNKGNDESGREEAEVTNSERVKVSERIRAFNGRGSSVGAIVGRARWSNSNAAITTGGETVRINTRRECISSVNNTSGKGVSSTIGETSIQEGEDATNMTSVGPLHEQNGMARNVNCERNTVGRPTTNNEVGVDSTSTTHVIVKRQQLRPNRKQQTMNELQIQHHKLPSDGSGGQMKYYRIVFKGMVLISSDLDYDRQRHAQQPDLQKLGIHSDGHATVSKATPDDDADNFKTNVKCGSIGEIYIGHGDIVGTSSPEIILPTNNNELLGADVDSADDRTTQLGGTTVFVRAIRVDTILTLGYAADDGDTFLDPDLAQIESTTMRRDFRNNICVRGKSNRESTATIGSHNEQHQQLVHQHRRGPYGYILLSDVNNLSIAEPLSTATANALRSSCQRGSFMYRVTASTPVPVLSGPSTDATGLGMGLLPGTIHEVSLRISVPLSPVDDDSEITSCGDIIDTLVDDADASEIQFLRLAQRRGWVADRTVNAIDQKLRVLYLMRDATNDVEFRGRFNQTLTGRSDCRHGGVERGIGLPDYSSSMNVEDNLSCSSSALNSVANSFFYSSVIASSIATPAIVKSRRRHNRRLPRSEEGGVERTQALSISSVVQHTYRVGESFEEAGSSVTGDGSSDVACRVGGGSSVLGEGNFQSAKRLYLIRVMAPLGLKILDNTEFQVSTLMHRPSLNTMNAWGSSTSPFSRTNAMVTSSSSADNSPTTTTVRKDRIRFFARGQVFEACQRMEVSPDTNLYTNGNGLIKLADLSGWAIVPHQHDIELAENGHRTTAYEEIGNALLPATQPNQMEDVASARLLRDVVWLRVVAPRNGAKVLLPPPRHQSSSTYGQRNNKVSHAAPPKASTSYDSETTSSFMDSVWNKITPSKGRETDHVLCDQTPVIPVIPCGMVVPVEPWEQSENSINFSRLFNGQGWIPRQLGAETFAYEVKTPDIRVGSFWFRVSTRSGVDVRHGPSLRAPVIQSEHGVSFRFECGEFLRASDVITVFEKSSSDVECYAKLFRRSNHLNDNDSSQSLLNRFSSLDSFATPGEWVQVHGGGELFLDECAAAPTIVRNRNGLQYTMTSYGSATGVQVYSGPSLQANIVRDLNGEGKIFLVTERVTFDCEEVSWLRLKNGGWICSMGRNGKSVVRALHNDS